MAKHRDSDDQALEDSVVADLMQAMRRTGHVKDFDAFLTADLRGRVEAAERRDMHRQQEG